MKSTPLYYLFLTALLACFGVCARSDAQEAGATTGSILVKLADGRPQSSFQVNNAAVQNPGENEYLRSTRILEAGRELAQDFSLPAVKHFLVRRGGNVPVAPGSSAYSSDEARFL